MRRMTPMTGCTNLLVIAIASVSYNQLPLGMVPPAPHEEAVGGEVVTTGTVRLFADPQMSTLLYEIDGNRVYRGSVSQGRIMLYVDGDRVYYGANTTGEILFTVSGARIFAGGGTRGPLAYTVAGGRVYEGSQTGPILYTIAGDRMFEGAHTTGEIVFQANTDLAGNIHSCCQSWRTCASNVRGCKIASRSSLLSSGGIRHCGSERETASSRRY